MCHSDFLLAGVEAPKSTYKLKIQGRVTKHKISLS